MVQGRPPQDRQESSVDLIDGVVVSKTKRFQTLPESDRVGGKQPEQLSVNRLIAPFPSTAVFA